MPSLAEEEPAGGDLALEQARLADRYERLEMVASRLAELSAATDPGRARRLREAIAQSRQQDVGSRFETIVELLEHERLSAAADDQKELQGELSSLLEMLLKDSRESQIESEQRRIRRFLREVNRMIRWQKGIRARTEGGDDQKSLQKDQGQLAEQTAELGGQVEPKGEGTEATEGAQGKGEESGEGTESESDSGEGQKGSPSESSKGQNGTPSPGGQPNDSSGGEQQPPQEPTDRAANRLRAAAERMRRAEERLEEAQREGAVEEQEQAVDELEQARAELERVLRQLREEEMERMLTLLAARFRRMLTAQLKINDDTLVVASVAVDQRGHREEIEAARLSHEETKIIRDADKALLLLREEGTSVAFPETVEQVRADMQEVADRLGKVLVDNLTQSIEQEIVESLEEVIAALEQEIQSLDDRQNNQPPGQQPGAPAEPALVNKIAELKLIRSLQERIYRRTVRYGQMMEEGQAEIGELLELLQELAERQERVHRATRDVATGRND